MKEGCNENSDDGIIGGVEGNGKEGVIFKRNGSFVKWEQAFSLLMQTDTSERPYSADGVTKHPFGHKLSTNNIKQDRRLL